MRPCSAGEIVIQTGSSTLAHCHDLAISTSCIFLLSNSTRVQSVHMQIPLENRRTKTIVTHYRRQGPFPSLFAAISVRSGVHAAIIVYSRRTARVLV